MGASRKSEEDKLESIQKGDLVRACGKSFQRYHKGFGLVIDVTDINGKICYEIYWNKTNRRQMWTAGCEFLKKVKHIS